MVAGGWCRLRLGNCRPSGLLTPDDGWTGVRWGHASPRPLRPEARQMCVDLHGRSAEASRIVQARLPIYAAIVTQFVTHLGDLATPSESRWQSLESGAPTSRTSGCTSPAKTIPRLADLEAKERDPARTSQETVAAGLAERTYESRNDEPAGTGDGSGGAARS